ncbi:MAG: hypothetical protein L3K15_09525, partial [Thermoplasmata archaeon]|nr:hypothetical protein [Thermoplasmata archaeon]
DPADGYVLLFGGRNTTTNLGDTWSFHDGNWSRLPVSMTPGNRGFPMLTYDVHDRYAVLFGGQNNTAYLNDTWEYSAGNWTQVHPTTAPAVRSNANFGYDPAENESVLYSGWAGQTGLLGDTWTFQAGRWNQLLAGGAPVQMSDMAVAYDPVNRSLLFFAGTYNEATVYHNQSWTFSHVGWTNVTRGTAPPSRGWGRMAYDARDGYLVLAGGRTKGELPGHSAIDTWAYGSANLYGVVTATPAQLETGATVNISAAAYPTTPNITQLYLGLPPGCTSANVSWLNCQPTIPGNYSIRVRFTDPHGNLNLSAASRLEVLPGPTLVSFRAMPSAISLGEWTNFTAVASGGSGPLTYTYWRLPWGCGTVNRSTLTCAPRNVGIYDVRVIVYDGGGGLARGTAHLEVAPWPKIGYFVVLPGPIDLGQPIRFSANATGGTLPFTFLYSGLPAGCASVNASLFDCTPTTVGLFPVILTLTDRSGATIRANGTVSVSPEPIGLPLNRSGAVTDVGVPVTIGVQVVGGSGSASVLYSGLPPGCTPSNAASFICTPTALGSYEVKIIATDVAGRSVGIIEPLRVNPMPTAPALLAVPAEFDIGMAVVFTPTALGGSPPFAGNYSRLPPGPCRPTGTSLSCVPGAKGAFAVEVRMTDLAGVNLTASRTITVAGDPSINSFTAGTGGTDVGVGVRLAVGVNGGTGALTIVYAGLPPGCSTANRPALDCVPLAAGTFALHVTVTDAVGWSASAEASLTVSGSVPSELTTIVLIAAIGVGGLGGVTALFWAAQRRRQRADVRSDQGPEG